NFIMSDISNSSLIYCRDLSSCYLLKSISRTNFSMDPSKCICVQNLRQIISSVTSCMIYTQYPYDDEDLETLLESLSNFMGNLQTVFVCNPEGLRVVKQILSGMRVLFQRKHAHELYYFL